LFTQPTEDSTREKIPRDQTLIIYRLNGIVQFQKQRSEDKSMCMQVIIRKTPKEIAQKVQQKG
jgi:hypothetical protein